jgi:GT2 family glycosyltransferase
MSIQEAQDLIRQNRIHEAFVLLQKLKNLPHPPKSAWLEWAGIATITPFSYLSIKAARKEFELFKSKEAKEFHDALEARLLEGKEKSAKDYPVISLIAIANEGTEETWKTCIDSLRLQFNTCIELILISNSETVIWGELPGFVKLRRPKSLPIINLAEIELAIRTCSGEIISVIDNPTSIFSDHGLLVIGAVFKSIPHMAVAQTERLCYGMEGIASPIRIEVPSWSQATLLDPVCLELPTHLFIWKGTYFRKNIILSLEKIFSDGILHAGAFDLVVKISRNNQIHSIKVPVVLDETALEARSFAISVSELSEASLIIKKELKILKSPPLISCPDLVEVSKAESKKYNLPKIAPFILAHGENAAPSITLVTAVYNGREYIERCIESILSQNYPNLEYIILDGGSNDGTQEIIKRYQKHLSHWSSKLDEGHYAAVQEGLKLSKSSIMSWLNADDYLCPYTLRLVASIFSERKHIEWITGKASILSNKGELFIDGATPLIDGLNYYEDAFDRPFIQQEGTFWRRSLWEKAGSCLDLRLNLAADMELWTRFLQHTKLFAVSVPLGVFMYRKGQRSEILKHRYYNEAYRVIQNLKSLGIKPYQENLNESTRIEIPLAD